MMYGGVEVLLHAFLTFAPHGGKWSAFYPSCFISGERVQSIHWIGGWEGPRAGWDAVVKRKDTFLAPARNHELQSFSP